MASEFRETRGIERLYRVSILCMDKMKMCLPRPWRLDAGQLPKNAALQQEVGEKFLLTPFLPPTLISSIR